MKIWLVRHAQPLVEAGICYGATEIRADDAATHTAARALALALPLGAQVSTSPLQRCEHLALILRGLRPDLTCKTDARLSEMNFGLWGGQRWDAIDHRELAAWTAAFETWRCGGGESVQDVMARVACAWGEAQATQQPTAWITHAGVIRAATLIAHGVRRVTQASQWPLQAPGFGEWWMQGNAGTCAKISMGDQKG